MRLALKLELLFLTRFRGGILGRGALCCNGVEDNIGVGRIGKAQAACHGNSGNLDVVHSRSLVKLHFLTRPAAVGEGGACNGRLVVNEAVDVRPVFLSFWIQEDIYARSRRGLFGVEICGGGCVAVRVGRCEVEGDGLANLIVGADPDRGRARESGGSRILKSVCARNRVFKGELNRHCVGGEAAALYGSDNSRSGGGFVNDRYARVADRAGEHAARVDGELAAGNGIGVFSLSQACALKRNFRSVADNVGDDDTAVASCNINKAARGTGLFLFDISKSVVELVDLGNNVALIGEVG